MQKCIDKTVDNKLRSLYTAFNEREDNLQNEEYKRALDGDFHVDELLLESKKQGNYSKLLTTGVDRRNLLLELAMFNDKKWAIGKTIRVKFLGGTLYIHQKIMYYVNVWATIVNLDFEFVVDGDAEIRIAFEPGSSWSNVGTDCLLVPAHEPTMNYGWFNPLTPEYEFRRTILHEFGHALGFIHEHQSPAAGIPWDVVAVYTEYALTDNWSTDDVDRNIFQKYSNQDVTNSVYDANSIMHYPIDSRLTAGAYQVGWNTTLSQIDIATARQWYPGRP